MISIFAPIYNDNNRIGSIFVTYYLNTVQQLLHTDFLSKRTDVYLFNPYSGNFVSCSDSDEIPAGTWNNVRLIKNDIKCAKGYNFDTWMDNMKIASTDNIINYTINDTAYSQAYVNIDGMSNWNIVIRIPINELSGTMHQFVLCTAICAILIIVATFIFAGSAYLGERNRNVALQNLSDIDPLTKVINRRAFNTKLDGFFEKNPKPICTYIFFDADHFKDVNDTYGHESGDIVLCRIAEILSDEFKDTGTVARVGGDEFNVFVYGQLSKDDINIIMAHIRLRLKQVKLADETVIPVSYSAGLAVMPSDADNIKDLIYCSDKALYYVKEKGRNNHYWYGDIPNDEKSV
jgi:diguanylate cyclase (GGDEF)-like protein